MLVKEAPDDKTDVNLINVVKIEINLEIKNDFCSILIRMIQRKHTFVDVTSPSNS